MIKCNKALGEIIERKRRYFTPNEMETLHVSHGKLILLEEMEEQGRLVILPCKVGDVVWRLEIGPQGKRLSARPQYVIYEFRISQVYGSKSLMFFGHNIINGKPSTSYEVFHEDDFGKTLFLTREAAEAALKGESKDV